MTPDNLPFESSKQWHPEGDKNYYSAHYFTIRVIFGIKSSQCQVGQCILVLIALCPLSYSHIHCGSFFSW